MNSRIRKYDTCQVRSTVVIRRNYGTADLAPMGTNVGTAKLANQKMNTDADADPDYVECPLGN